MRVDFTESALRDLEDIIAYYIEQKVPEIGEQYVSDIVRHTEARKSVGGGKGVVGCVDTRGGLDYDGKTEMKYY